LKQKLIEKLNALRCLKAPVLPPQSDKAHAELRCFANPCINLLVRPSVTREYHPKLFELLDLRCSVLPLTCTIHCLGFMERYHTSVLLLLIFILAWSHAAVG